MRVAAAAAALMIVAGCTKQTADKVTDPPAKSAETDSSGPNQIPKDTSMTDKDTPITKAPPPIKNKPAEDTARYVAWMAKQGKPITDTAREDVSLRVGDWGFFDHGGSGPGAFRDKAALDKADHVILPTDKGDAGGWHAFLGTPGLDAAAAHARIAWLYGASAVDPATTQLANKDKLTKPKLTASAGSITFEGWLVYPPNMNSPMRITIIATASGAKFVHESQKQL